MNSASLCSQLDTFANKAAVADLGLILSGSRPQPLFPAKDLSAGVSLNDFADKVRAYRNRLDRQNKQLSQKRNNVSEIKAGLAEKSESQKKTVKRWTYTIVCLLISVVSAFTVTPAIASFVSELASDVLENFLTGEFDLSGYYAQPVQLAVGIAITLIVTSIARKLASRKSYGPGVPGGLAYGVGIAVAVLSAPLLPVLPFLFVVGIVLVFAFFWYRFLARTFFGIGKD